MRVHLVGEHCALVAFFGALAHVAHIVADARNAQQARFLIHELIDLRRREVFGFFQKRNDGRVDGAAARAHHKAVKRSEAHGSVDGDAVVDGGNRATIAQMARDDLQVFDRLLHKGRAALCDIAVRRSMRAVFANLMLLAQLVWQRIHVCRRRKRLEERRVKNGHLRHIGSHALAHVDAFERGRVMERRQRAEAFDFLDDIGRDEHRGVEIIATMYDAMPDGVDFVNGVDGRTLAVAQCIEYDGQCLFVVGHVLGEDALVFVGAVLDVGIFASDAFAQALGEHLIVFSVDELVFQRRRASVDDENFHEVPPCRTILESRRSGVHRSAAQNVHMDVMYRLLGVVAGVDDNAIAGFIDALDFRYLFHGIEKMAHKVVGQTVANVGEVLLRDDERMHRHLGFKVVERDNLVVLVYYAGGNFTSGNFAEYAVGHMPCCLSRAMRALREFYAL